MATRKNEAIWIEKNKRWQIKVQKDGERRAFYSNIIGKKGKIDAERKADKWIETGSQKENIRLNKLWESFLNDCMGNYAQHEQMGRLWLLPKLTHKKVVSITMQDWQNCLNEAFKKGLSKKSLKNIRGSITALCKYAKRKRIPMEQPYDLSIPQNAPVKTKNILQPVDIKTLFQQSTIFIRGKEKDCFFIHSFRFILLTGIRRNECCNLKHSDIENGILHVRGSKSNAANRYFVLSKQMLSVLTAQQELLKSIGIISPWIFPDEYGNQLDPNHLYKKWCFYRKQNGIKSTLHEMRHTLISVSKADMPPELLKMIVGHTTNTDTFGIYGHEVDGELQRAANIIDEIFIKLLK